MVGSGCGMGKDEGGSAALPPASYLSGLNAVSSSL